VSLDHDRRPIGGSGEEPPVICESIPRPSPQCSQLELVGTDDQDAALMVAVGQGSAPAFALLVERHTPQLYRLAARMLGDRFEAEDVVQECFTRLWQNAPRWQPSGAGLVGWLHRVTMNLCLDRKRRFRVIITPDVPDCQDPAPLADVLIQADQARCAVADALAALPARHRAALVLCYYEGHSNASAAQVLELNIKALESLLFRARRLMRERLETRAQTWGEIAPMHASAMT
jgi:RNA polymerase sigma-70 factor, ECF subfamily